MEVAPSSARGACLRFVTAGDSKTRAWLCGRKRRRLLDSDFMCTRLRETTAQFIVRMKRVEEFMNSPNLAHANGGRGLAGLARELPDRCELVIQRKAERIPK